MWQVLNLDDPDQLHWYRGDPADVQDSLAELLGAVDRPKWHAEAACRGRPNGVTWFPDRGHSYKPAVAVCATCPVREPCREYAIQAGPMLAGIWAGHPQSTRRATVAEVA